MTALDDYAKQIGQPAAPAGLQQYSAAMAGGQGQTALDRQARREGYDPSSQQWYTGGNTEGTNNGWDNQFVHDFITGQNEAAKQGTLGSYFSQPEATGVVTWDHKSTDGTTDYKFGDVYEKGQFKGNVYDTSPSKAQANLMMAQFILDPETQRHIFSASDAPERLDREIQAKRQSNDVEIPKATSAAAFQAKVDTRAASIEQGGSETAIVAGAGAASAAVAAPIGFAAGEAVFPAGGGVVGAGLFAVGGFLTGAAGAFLNKDALAQQAARAYEITALSSRENGGAAGLATGISQWSGFGGKLISPASNLTQGIYDASKGKVGDGTSEFYRLDDKGHSNVPKAIKVLDVAAAVGDSALQFSNPIGVGLYSTQMTGTIAGEVGELALTGGKSFDYTRGGFDSIFTDDNGNFSPLRAAAGIGKVGIDAVQLGMARGLLSKAQSARSAVGARAVGENAPGVFGRIGARLYGGRGEENVRELAGRKIAIGEDGKAIEGGSRFTLSILAPSEQLSYLEARITGMRRAAARPTDNVYTADDFYVAANALATGERKVKTAIVTGVGEAYEEGIQQILDPYSHNEKINLSDIFSSAAYGFAGGAGMGAGIGFRSPNSADKMYAQASLAYSNRTNGATLSRSEFDGMTEVQRRSLASQAGVESALQKAANDKIVRDQSADSTASVVATSKMYDGIQTALAQNLATGTDRTDQPLVIAPIESADTRSDAVVTSGLQLARNFVNRMHGIAVQQESLQRTKDLSDQALAADPTNAEQQARSTELAAQLATLTRMVQFGNAIDQELDVRIGRMYAPGADLATIEAEATDLNDLLQGAFDRGIDVVNIDGIATTLTDADKFALAKVISQVVTRDPQDQAGSYQVLVPQVSISLTAAKSDNLVQISNAILPAIRGDYDGDKIRTLQQLMLDDNEFISARAGQHFLGAGTSVNVGAPHYEEWNIKAMSEALSGTNSALANFADGMLIQIGTQIRTRYAGVIDNSVLDEVLTGFFNAVKAGAKDARSTLLDGLAAKAGGQVTAFARENLSNEWLWVDQLMRVSTQQFQRAYAAHSPNIGAPVNTNTLVAPEQRDSEVRTRQADRAAVLGQQLALETVGDTIFRKFQKIHYTSQTAAVLSADTTEGRTLLYDMAAFYEALGAQITRSELDNVRGKDDITTRVYAQLRRIADDAARVLEVNASQALVVVANMRVSDFDIDAKTNEPVASGKTITLAQLLLKRSVQRDRREKDSIWAASPELQAKHAKLLAMTRPPTQGIKGSRPVNAERAFVEVVGSQQLFVLLGEEANVFGPHLTVEQFLRSYVSQHELERRDTDHLLKTESAYLGRKKHTNIPYDLDEVNAKEISAYRSVVDSILAVGHNRITMDPKGILHGEFADRSDRTSQDIQAAHSELRRALQAFVKISPRRNGESNEHLVQRMFESNPDTERLLWGLVPNNVVNAVFEIRDDKLYAANWVYSMFTIKDSKQAEMHYWRNLLLAEINASGALAANSVEENDEGHAGRKYDKQTRRMARIVWNLASQDDGGVLLSKFIREMENATDLEKFIKWVNTTPGVRGDQAPVTAWVDDVAEFDMDKAQGGWTTALQGAELRLAATALKKGATALVKDLNEEQSSIKADTQVLEAVKRVLRHDAGDTSVVLDSGDRALHDQLAKVIEQAGNLQMGMGPQAMLFQTIGAVRMFNGQSHTKGVTPDYVELQGMFDALRDAYGYTSNFERVFSALTGLDLDAVGNGLEQVAKDAGRTMDDEGRTVEWAQPTVASVVELLSNTDTRPMARAILFPQVMERDFDGVLRPKMLVGKNLRSLLNGASHKELFPQNGKLSQDSALRYLSNVEAIARQYGGHFSVQRAANDRAIARVSAADHVLTTGEIETIVLEVYQGLARELQATGSVLAASATPGTDPLAEVLAQAKKANHTVRLGRQFKLEPGEEDVMLPIVFDQLVTEMELQGERDKQILAGTGLTQQELDDKFTDIDKSVEAFKKKLDLLRSDDLVGQVMAMFTIPVGPSKPGTDIVGDVKSSLVRYVTSNLAMIETSSSSLLLLQKLTGQLMDSGRSGQVDLDDAEWHELSNAVVAHYLDRVASVTANGVSVPPFPDMDHVADQRYYDRTFNYLLDSTFTAKSPLVLAARDLHRRAGRTGTVATVQEMVDILGQTVFKDFSLGDWTSDIPRASIEANQRLDSASAAQAISMYGNLPKRQAVISAATRRTFEVPPDTLLSTADLSWIDLSKSGFDEVAINHPGQPAVLRPLVQLDNRFARSVVLHYVDATGAPQDMEILTGPDSWPDLGRPFAANDIAAASGFQEIRLDRLRQAVDQKMSVLKINPVGTTVTVSFLHPDMQPASPEWFNNLFFEGTSFILDADRHESLNSTLFFAEGSINPVGQATALDASKLGQPAFKTVATTSSVDRAALEADFATDFAAMLRAKTKVILESDLGTKNPLGPEFYNAVYKNMKLRHFVRGTNEAGVNVLLSAEEVIAHQLAGTMPVLTDAALWIPSDDVLRSMLGEQGGQGITRILNLDLQIDLSRVPTYRGVNLTDIAGFSKTTAESMGAILTALSPGISGETIELHQTRVANRARQSQLQVRVRMDDRQRATYDAMMKVRAEQQSAAWTDRSEIQRLDEKGGFSPKANMLAALQTADSMLRAENIAFDWGGIGIPYIGPRNPADMELSKMLLHDLAAALDAEGGFRTGWILENDGPANPPAGLLSNVSLTTGKQRAGLMVAPGDLVVIRLDSYRGDYAKASKDMEWLMNRGAIIVLGANDGQADMRNDLSIHLEELNYVRILGSKHVYQPAITTARYQNQRARLSTLTEMRGVSTRSMVSVFTVADQPIEENGAWVNSDNERLGAIAVSLNLVPTDFLAGYNVPVEQFSNISQIERTRQHILGLDTVEGRAMLREMRADPKWTDEERAKADTDFNKFFDRLIQRFDNPGTVLPAAGSDFGTGDFIPLVDGYGHVLLYQHGMKAPDWNQVQRMQAQQLPGKQDAANVAIFPAKPEPAATTHVGTVVGFNPRSAHGLDVELEIPLQVFGDKKVLEWNGMKYLLTPRPDSLVLPDHGFFANGWGVDIVASIHDSMSKESFDGLVNNHRNAFAYFGVNFLDDVAKFFNTDAAHARELLHAFATRAPRIQVSAADEIINAGRLDSAFLANLPAFASQFSELASPAWVNGLSELITPESQIVAAMLVYLSTPGARVSDVLRSGGFNDDTNDPDSQSILMPRLFTQVFDNAPLGSPLRQLMNERINDQLHNPHTDGTGYRMLENWTFQILNSNSEDNLSGFLQFAEAHSSGDNPVKNGMAFDSDAKGAVSAHSAAIAYQAIGAETGHSYDLAKARLFASGAGVERFAKDANDGGVWRMLTNIDENDRSAGAAWRAQTAGEAARRSLARDAVTQFRQPVDTADDKGWTDKLRLGREEVAQSIVRALGLQDNQIELVDFWVRQILGAPAGQDVDGHELGNISGRDYIDIAKNDILWAVENHYLPTVGAEVPLLHVADLQLIFRANEQNGIWAPREALGAGASQADSWDSWVETSLGSALLSDNLFDSLYLLVLDGFMHTYQSATRSLIDLPVSFDSLLAQELYDPETNRLIASLEEGTDRTAMEPIQLDITRATLDDLLGGTRIAGKFRGKAAPASAIAKKREKRRQWRKETDIPVPVDVSLKNFRKNGREFINYSTATNSFARMLINLRIGTALLNPALYLSMGPEQWVRGTLDRVANLITGESTAGVTAKVAAYTGLSAYTPDQLTKLNRLTQTLGKRADFKSMIYRDLMFLRPHEAGIGKLERAFETYAKIGSSIQDPTHGMRAKTLARRYLEAALQHINMMPTLSVISTDQLIDELTTNPHFLKDNFPEAHLAGTNSIAQLRSLKPTILSLTLRGIYEPLSESTNSAHNFLGNVLLRMPLLFSGYAMNVLTTITGLQGLDQLTAAFLHGRQKGLPGFENSLIGRVQAKMRGELFDENKDATFDMSSVMEGIDLSRAFIRGGLTHTGLFAFGMMAGGLGLSGEDDEARKRRRAAQLQGAGFVYDPRAIENDFRNVDSIFLDHLPFGFGSWFKNGDPSNPGAGRDIAQLNWTLKQFISPIMGMERFFETGDFRHVTWGFEDALGSFPLINSLMWDDAVQTAHELASQADSVAEQDQKDSKQQTSLGGPGALPHAAWLLTNATGVFERMLFENAFVNQLYTSFDRYDRDPYALPLRDSDGKLQRDIENNPRKNNIAMEPYIDPETGQIKQGYLGRDESSSTLHALAENRATLAFVASMFTGLGNSDYNRYNMPIKTRTMDKPPITQDFAEGLIRAASQGAGGQQNLTADELAQLWKDDFAKKGKYVDWGMIDAAAAKAAKAGTYGTGQAAPMSVLDKDGREALTADGARAIMQGLTKGSVKLDDASLAGIYIPFEMRNTIQKEWMAELIQEGVDMGLDQTKATSRMKRLWYGPTTDPSIQGLGDILWSKDISYSDKRTYNQLNTTYVVGPDGRPWATGFTRGGLMVALGAQPLKRAYSSEQSATSTDARLNTTDFVNGVNTGLRGLELVDDSRNIPTDVEIGKSIEEAIKAAAKDSYTPYAPNKSTGKGYKGYNGYRRGGYGGGGSGGGYFHNMYTLPGGTSPYGNTIPFINTSNPIIRRSQVRRERVWSERGRLKQWQ